MKEVLYRWILRYLEAVGFILYGGSGGGGTSTQVVQNYSPEETARRLKVFDIGQAVYDQTAQNVANNPYPGPAPVGLDPQTVQAQNLARSQVPYLQQQAQQLGNSQAFALGPVLYPQSNPALQQYIQTGVVQPAIQGLTDAGGALSNIRSGAQSAGQFGSTRQGIGEGLATARTIQDITAKSAGLSAQAYGQGLEAMGRAQALAPQTMQAQLFPAQALEALGRSNEAYAQEQENFAAQARQYELTKDWQALAPFASLIFGAGSSQSTTTATNTAPQPNRTAGVLGGAASGAAMGTMVYPGIGTAVGAVIGGLMGAMQ